MPLILAIDCSDRACSIALGNALSFTEKFTDQARQHAKQLLPFYRQLLAESEFAQQDIDAIAVTEGPGSFTGLRIGFSFAQGLAFALDKPLILVSSLQALAATHLSQLNSQVKQIETVFDARMGELYAASFAVKDTQLVRRCADRLIGYQDLQINTDQRELALLGSGFSLPEITNLRAAHKDADACIRASSLLAFAAEALAKGETTDAVGAEPAYLRRSTAWKSLDQQRRGAEVKL